MKNNKFSSLFKDFRFVMLLPVVIMLLAVIFGVIFKFNTTTEFKTTYTFNVKYNTSLSEENYEDYACELSKVLNKEADGKFDYKLEQLNENIALSTKVTIYNSSLTSAELENDFTAISEKIETAVNAKIGSGHIEVTELNKINGISYTKEVLKALLVVGIITVIMFAYIWFRFELKMALCSLLLLPYNIGILTALLLLFRLPVNTMFMVPYILTTILSYILFMIVGDKIREELDLDLFAEANNQTLLNGSLITNKNVLLILLISFSGALLLSMLSLSSKVIFTAILSLIGIVVAIYSTIFVAFGLWTKVYNKDSDKRLKAKKLKKEQPKTKKSKTEELV